MSLLLLPLLAHILLEFLVVVIDFHLFGVQFTVALGEFPIVRLDLELPVDLGVAVALDGTGGVGNLGGEDLVLFELLLRNPPASHSVSVAFVEFLYEICIVFSLYIHILQTCNPFQSEHDTWPNIR